MGKVRIIGTYQPVRTALHGIDARAKIVFLLLAGIALIAAHSWPGCAVCALILLAALLLARIRPLQLAAAVKPCGVLIATLMVLCALIPPSWAGLARGVNLAVRIIIFTAFVLVVNATTTPTQLVDAYGQLLSPLGRLGIKTVGIAVNLAWLTQLIPLTVEENMRIAAAQTARGRRAPASVATALGNVARARTDAVQAMERRGYTGAPSARMRVSDWPAIAVGVAMVVLAVIL